VAEAVWTRLEFYSHVAAVAIPSSLHNCILATLRPGKQIHFGCALVPVESASEGLHSPDSTHPLARSTTRPANRQLPRPARASRRMSACHSLSDESGAVSRFPIWRSVHHLLTCCWRCVDYLPCCRHHRRTSDHPRPSAALYHIWQAPPRPTLHEPTQDRCTSLHACTAVRAALNTAVVIYPLLTSFHLTKTAFSARSADCVLAPHTTCRGTDPAGTLATTVPITSRVASPPQFQTTSKTLRLSRRARSLIRGQNLTQGYAQSSTRRLPG
jgi:hypothetical protein